MAMGLFSKKTCSICGGDAGRVFTKKLEDGVLCKSCTGKLSPWFSERRSSTVAQIEEQLRYREANEKLVAEFKVTRTFNGRYKVLLDEDAGKFCVVGSGNWRDDNPDIFDFSDVTGCSYEIRESKIDVTPEPPEEDEMGMGHGGGFDDHRGGRPDFDDRRGPAGHGGPQGGPHGGPYGGGPRPGETIYEYDYDFYMTINVNNPFFSEIEYQVNESDIEELDGAEYRSCLNLCEEIKAALTQVREQGRAAAAPKQAVNCPNCGATTMPTSSGCCEYCGSAL